MRTRAGWLVAAGLLAAGCASARGSLVRDSTELQGAREAYASGEIAGLSQRAVLDARDFSYAVDLTGHPASVAYTHLGAKEFFLGLATLDPEPGAVMHSAVNENRHDVEALAFAPDGARVAVGSRDGTLRVYDRASAKLLQAHASGEPLTAVAWSPSGSSVAAGSATGKLLLFRGEDLQLAGSARAHSDEIRALAFDDAGTLYSGGWDKQIRSWKLAHGEGVVTQARVRFERHGHLVLLPVWIGSGAPLKLAYDARASRTALTGPSARAAGVDALKLTETVEVVTAGGPIAAPLAREVPVAFQTLRPRIDAVICDACVPPGAAGVIGADFLARFAVQFDETTGEAVLTAREAGGQPQAVITVEPGATLTFPYFVNDLTVDRKGEVLGVAFGETKAERTLEVYQREKKKIEEPLAEGNAAARVDARTGTVLERHVVHHGIVATAAVSPDGRSLVSGGWDKKLLVYSGKGEQPVFEDNDTFGWSVRRARFSRDGRYLGVAAWTPQIPRPDTDSDPALVVFDVRYVAPEIRR